MSVTAPTPEPAAASSAAPAPAPAPAAAPPAPAAKEPSAASLLYAELDDVPAPAPAAAQNDDNDDGADPAPPNTDAPAGEKASATDPVAETLGTIEELIAHHQLDPEWFNSLKVDVKVDRQTMQVPFADLIKSYQIDTAATKRLEDAKTHAKAITQDLAIQKETLQTQLSSAAALVKHAEALLERDAKGVNWAQLREKDPAEYAAKKADFEEQRKFIASLKDEGANAWRAAVQQQQSAAVDGLKERLATENEALLGAIPEWKDEKTRTAEKAALVKYLTGPVGLTQEQVAVVADHRMIVMARKAMNWDELQTKTDAAKQKVVKIPKVLKPGAAAAAAAAPKDTSMLEDLYGSS